MLLPKQVNLAEVAYLQHQMNEEAEIQARVIKARELYAGYIDEDLAEAAADIIIGGEESDIEGVNLMAIAINTTIRRLTLTGFEVVSPSEEGEGPEIGDEQLKTIRQWVAKMYKENKIENLSRDLHRKCERDGEAFLLMEYDQFYVYRRDPAQEGLVKFYIHERYTDPGTTWKGFQGSGEGCKAHYRNNDVNQPLDMISKRWVEEYFEDEEVKTRQRMTLYINKQGNPLIGDEIPARIEKYELDETGEWAPYQDEEDEGWPIWWTEGRSETGVSLPLPVIHFRNEEFEPGQKKIWGLQAAMDQLFVGFVNAELVTGHQILVALGFYPTDDGKPPNEEGTNLLKVAPRQIIGTASKGPRDADVKAIPPAAIEPLLQGLDKIAIYASFVGSLPVSNFIFSKSVASSETLKQGDAELVARVNELKGLWTDSWELAMDTARKLTLIFGQEKMDERPTIQPQWSPAERRDMNHLQKEAAAKREAGVPEVVILQEVWGYTPEQAQDYLQKNIAEHQQGIGPEVVGMQQGDLNGQNRQGEQSTSATNVPQEHGNSSSEQPQTVVQNQ